MQARDCVIDSVHDAEFTAVHLADRVGNDVAHCLCDGRVCAPTDDAVTHVRAVIERGRKCAHRGRVRVGRGSLAVTALKGHACSGRGGDEPEERAEERRVALSNVERCRKDDVVEGALHGRSGPGRLGKAKGDGDGVEDCRPCPTAVPTARGVVHAARARNVIAQLLQGRITRTAHGVVFSASVCFELSAECRSEEARCARTPLCVSHQAGVRALLEVPFPKLDGRVSHLVMLTLRCRDARVRIELALERHRGELVGELDVGGRRG